MTERVVVIGADAAGASAASTLKRLRGDDVEVIVLDRGEFSSYSACGIPYWIAGDVDSRDDLIARTPEKHRENGIDLRMRQEVEGIDVSGARVSVRDLETGASSHIGFDHLVIATGARPIRPDLPGIDAGGVCAVNNLTQATHVQEALARGPQEAVVVGAGYIGIEMAEALLRRGLKVTVVDAGPEPMGTLDRELGALVREAMATMGLLMRSETKVTGFDTDADGHVTGVRTDGGTEPAELVILGIGVRPEVTLAEDAGLTIGDAGGIRTDDRQRVEGAENIWAGGDCVEVWDRLAKGWATIALGTHANAHGRIIGANLAGRDAHFPGVLGTAISKVCNLEVARTGLGEAAAGEAGLRRRRGHHRVHHLRRLPAARRPDHREADRRTRRRAAARRPDRRPGTGCRQAHRRHRGRAVERDDRGRPGRGRPVLRPALLSRPRPGRGRRGQGRASSQPAVTSERTRAIATTCSDATGC